jgi:hypothetical protein
LRSSSRSRRIAWPACATLVEERAFTQTRAIAGMRAKGFRCWRVVLVPCRVLCTARRASLPKGPDRSPQHTLRAFRSPQPDSMSTTSVVRGESHNQSPSARGRSVGRVEPLGISHPSIHRATMPPCAWISSNGLGDALPAARPIE